MIKAILFLLLAGLAYAQDGYVQPPNCGTVTIVTGFPVGPPSLATATTAVVQAPCPPVFVQPCTGGYQFVAGCILPSGVPPVAPVLLEATPAALPI